MRAAYDDALKAYWENTDTLNSVAHLEAQRDAKASFKEFVLDVRVAGAGEDENAAAGVKAAWEDQVGVAN